MKKFINKKSLLSFLIIGILIAIPVIVYAADGVSGQDPGAFAVTALGKIKNLLWKIASPLAAVALMTCFAIQKASFGNQETIAMAKTWRKNIIVGYIVIMCINVIMYALDSLLGVSISTI